jgi:hypothetical protein
MDSDGVQKVIAIIERIETSSEKSSISFCAFLSGPHQSRKVDGFQNCMPLTCL